jgi:MarR family transcriptional regulator for hemolysin
LLKRCGSETDRRVKHLQLSATGKKAVERIRSSAAELRREILAGTSEEQIGIAIEVMENIRNKLAELS